MGAFKFAEHRWLMIADFLYWWILGAKKSQFISMALLNQISFETNQKSKYKVD